MYIRVELENEDRRRHLVGANNSRNVKWYSRHWRRPTPLIPFVNYKGVLNRFLVGIEGRKLIEAGLVMVIS